MNKKETHKFLDYWKILDWRIDESTDFSLGVWRKMLISFTYSEATAGLRHYYRHNSHVPTAYDLHYSITYMKQLEVQAAEADKLMENEEQYQDIIYSNYGVDPGFNEGLFE